ncbi:site-specific integrase [Stenotrophomonas maltophilia]|uniref:site-specific integrase n=1 Tax=Stenotrophomonas maltophilia TaxID=40324 RepID=UPI000C160498|nr:site-specific integrase [Stenotrophomonas maltophilia]MCF3536718.1 tyrosine-type recombinase/integrase [Stenotrophomonas maltophilia]
MKTERRPLGRVKQAALSALSKDGYPFDPSSNQWRLNKDVQLSLVLPHNIDPSVESGFRATLLRYAEEASGHHAYNMEKGFKKYLRDTGASHVSVAELINWRATLGTHDQWKLGGLKGFLLAWHDYGFDGVSTEVVDLLQGWRIQGNEKGAAVASGCPDSGPYTDLEMAALLDWANLAITRRNISLEDYAYLLALAMTARRPVQLAALRGRDLIRDSTRGVQTFRLRIPRAKQRGIKFRGAFRTLAVIEDLYLVLQQLHQRSVALASETVEQAIEPELAGELPVFINRGRLMQVRSVHEMKGLLMGDAPDRLHATTSSLSSALQRCARASTARSERTGEFIRLSATRFRHTRGTKLRREGFGAFVIAELLDHSDVQNVSIYTKNTAQEAVMINELVGAQLAPFAQACLGKLVASEREAIRGGDPRSRVANERQNAVGTCGNYGFCASGYRACYTCSHFQPWVDGPHEEVLTDLYAEKDRTRAAGCADAVVNANDQLILAVEHCVAMCRTARSIE